MTLSDRWTLWWAGICTKHLLKKNRTLLTWHGRIYVCEECYTERRHKEWTKENNKATKIAQRISKIQKERVIYERNEA